MVSAKVEYFLGRIIRMFQLTLLHLHKIIKNNYTKNILKIKIQHSEMSVQTKKTRIYKLSKIWYKTNNY